MFKQTECIVENNSIRVATTGNDSDVIATVTNKKNECIRIAFDDDLGHLLPFIVKENESIDILADAVGYIMLHAFSSDMFAVEVIPEITKEMITKGLRSGVIRLISEDAEHPMSTVCQFVGTVFHISGSLWFYFDGKTAETTPPGRVQGERS